MTAPDIPEDIRGRAAEIAGEIDRLFSVYDDSVSLDYEAASECISLALLSERTRTTEAERERCAKIAEQLIIDRRGLSLSFDMIAASIRTEGTKP